MQNLEEISFPYLFMSVWYDFGQAQLAQSPTQKLSTNVNLTLHDLHERGVVQSSWLMC